MKDPAKNDAALNSFSFTGTITGIEYQKKTLQLLVHQDVAARMPTDYKLVIPKAIVTTEVFPYVQGDTIIVEDALLYAKNHEMRLRIDSMTQIRSTTARAGDFNALSYSGKIVGVKEDRNCHLVTFEQTVLDTFKTCLEVVVPSTIKMDVPPKVGDIGYVKSAILYEKEGSFRAKIDRPTYQVLYSPDIVMSMGTVEAKEVFAG